MKSIAIPVGVVTKFPEFEPRTLYMHKTLMNELCLPLAFSDYTTLVEQMLLSIPADKLDAVCYITIDSKVVNNSTHRRGGPHCDFNWYEDGIRHEAPGHSRPTHSPTQDPRWRAPQHIEPPKREQGGHGSPTGPAHSYLNAELGGMLLVSDYSDCRVWNGEYKFPDIPGLGGDCSHFGLGHMQTELMPRNEVYYLNALGIHESLPIVGQVERQLIRINFHPECKAQFAAL